MDDRGSIDPIFVAPDSGEPMESVDSVDAVAGEGLRGDRYFRETGLYDRRETLPDATDVTLVERGPLEDANRDGATTIRPSETRRNVVTRGVPLNDLVDETFAVGDATFVGVRLCEPCGYMESLAGTDDRRGRRRRILSRPHRRRAPRDARALFVKK